MRVRKAFANETLYCRNPTERPTADMLLSQHPFCDLDPGYNFFSTELYTKIKGTY